MLYGEQNYAEYKGLITSRAAFMRELKNSDLWQRFYEVGMERLEDCRARTVTGTKDEFEFNKGLYEGTRRLLMLPLDIIEEAERIAQADKESERFESRRPKR